MNLLSWASNYKILGGGVLYGIAAVLFIIALKHGNLSVLYPIIATSYIWVAVLSWLVLHEPFSWAQGVGLVFILTGISLIVRQ